MIDLKKYDMSEISYPQIGEYSTIYYYLNGKCVGLRKYSSVTKDYIYYELLGARREVKSISDIKYAVSESVTDTESYENAKREYESYIGRQTTIFLADLIETYDIDTPTAKYFYERYFTDGLDVVIKEVEFFNKYINR